MTADTAPCNGTLAPYPTPITSEPPASTTPLMPDTTLDPELDTATPNTELGPGEVTTLGPETETTTEKIWEVSIKEKSPKNTIAICSKMNE